MKDRREYTDETTQRCERALITLIGNIGPWSKRIYLAGGLAPRYIIGSPPDAVPAHIGTTDVDMVIGLAIDDAEETYSTLRANLKKTGFKQTQLSYQWECEVDGANVLVEFLCETDQVEPGFIHRPKAGTGSKLGAFNSRCATTRSTRSPASDSMKADNRRLSSKSSAFSPSRC